MINNILDQKFLADNDESLFSHGGTRLKTKKIKNPIFSIITVVLNNEKFLHL